MALLIASAPTLAIGGTISFKGGVVEATRATDSPRMSASGDAPHSVTQQAFDSIPAKGELLEYFADRCREAGVGSERLRLITADYL